MLYMEIARLQNGGIRLKGKRATIAVDKYDKLANAFLLLSKEAGFDSTDETIVFNGPGEYEVGGVKMTGFQNNNHTVYSMTIDSITILLGGIESLQKLQSKLKEHDIVIVSSDAVPTESAAFLTSLAANVIIFYGEKAVELNQVFPTEKSQQINKYSITREKLPAEIETIVLQ